MPTSETGYMIQLCIIAIQCRYPPETRRFEVSRIHMAEESTGMREKGTEGRSISMPRKRRLKEQWTA